jgi:hypothetical protein
MKSMKILLALSVSAAMFALPAMASAGTWSLDPAGTAFTASSVGNTVLTTNNNETVTCTSSTGTGSYNAGSTTDGTVTFKFHNCSSSGFACTTAGQPSGTIVTTLATFKNVYLEPGPKTPGLTLKGKDANEHFASFSCAFGFVNVVVTGTLLGEVEEPAKVCNVPTKKIPLAFVSIKHGFQKWTQVTTAGLVEDLTATVNEVPRTASQDGTGFVETVNNVTPTCVAEA